jgi:ATP-binding cassette subfamily B protein
MDTGRLSGLIECSDLSFSYDERGRRSRTPLTALPGQTIALVGPTGAGKSTAIARCTAPSIRNPASSDRRHVRALKLTALRRNIGVVFKRRPLQPLDRRQSSRRQAGRDR